MKGSLTGAVTSQIVTEACKGGFKFSKLKSIMTNNCLTVRLTHQAEINSRP